LIVDDPFTNAARALAMCIQRRAVNAIARLTWQKESLSHLRHVGALQRQQSAASFVA
jgi:hypothetical protein